MQKVVLTKLEHNLPAQMFLTGGQMHAIMPS